MINLIKIRDTIQVRSPGIPVQADNKFIVYLNSVIDNINMELESVFPNIPSGTDLTLGYAPFPDGWENLFENGIIYLFLIDDEELENAQAIYALFAQSLKKLKDTYRIPFEYQKKSNEYFKDTFLMGHKKTPSSTDIFYPKEKTTFFRNNTLIEMYENNQILSADLRYLYVDPQYWGYLKKFEVDLDGKILLSTFKLSLPFSYENFNGNIEYELNLSMNGLVFTQHQDEIIKLCFIPDTPAAVLATIWRTI